MAKSNIKLPNGTEITVEGSTEEIKKILSIYSSTPSSQEVTHSVSPGQKKTSTDGGGSKIGQDPIVEIVNTIKETNAAESIEKNILDRSSQINRIILPLYISSKELKNAFSLTSGEIAQILNELGTPISVANVSGALAGVASKYVVGDKARKRGHSTRYKISLRGSKYLESVILGAEK